MVLELLRLLNVLRWSRKLGDAAPNPCAGKMSRNSVRGCIQSTFHLLFVRNSSKPVDGKMMSQLFKLSYSVHPYIGSSSLVVTVNSIAHSAYLAVNLFHFNSLLRNHIDRSRLSSSDRSLNLQHRLSFHLLCLNNQKKICVGKEKTFFVCVFD